MKNFLLAILAFGSLIASGIAGPVGPAVKADTGLVGRTSTNYADQKKQVNDLLDNVKIYTGQLNKTLSSTSDTLLETEKDKEQLAIQLNSQLKNITQLLNHARSTKNKNKHDNLDSRDDSNDDTTCDQDCIYEAVQELVYEIADTINYIIAECGIDAVFDYLTPMIMALIQLLAYWDVSIMGLVVSVKEIVDGIFVSIGITIIAIVIQS